MSYSRIEPPACKTDAFSGLYLGAFGPHGPELLRLQRGRSEDGEELVIGTKLTGDANVPAGAVSFRARIGRKRRLEPRDVYPDDLGVVARYAGGAHTAVAAPLPAPRLHRSVALTVSDCAVTWVAVSEAMHPWRAC